MIKNLLLGASLVMGTLTLSAQRQVGAELPLNRDFRTIQENSVSDLRDVTDTLAGPILEGCDPTPILLGSNNGGFVIGGNGYGDLEKAQYIDTDSEGTIYSFLVWVGGKDGGTNETFSGKIYEGNTTEGPMTEIATSMAVSYADLDTSAAGGYTTFAFSEPVGYATPFFASLEVSNGNALFGIVHTNDMCGGNGAWELWNDDTWNSIDDAWGDLDVLTYVFVEVESSTVSTDDTYLIKRGSEKVFPNPTSGNATLIYSLVEPTDISVRVYSSTGVLVDSFVAGKQSAGLNQVELNTENLASGVYVYSIQTESGVRNGRFTVAK